MGKATGIFLILAGVGTAALVLPSVDKDAERQLADVVRIATGGSTSTPNAQQPEAAAPAAATQKPPVTVSAGHSLRAAAAQASPPAQPAPSSVSNPEPVSIPPPQVLVRNASANGASGDAVQARQILTRDIQQELKRVGCYDGEVSGEWSPTTRRAMKSFIDRVNAALPIDEPDHILRTMVQGHPGNACGRTPCPAGQTAGGEGRCLPAATIAQVPVPRPAVRTADAKPVDTNRNDPIRTAPAASAPDVAAMRPTVPKSSWETTIAAAPPKPLSTEGRMAIGGPASTSASANGSNAAPTSVGLVPRQAATGSTTGATTSTTTTPSVSIVPGAIAALATGASGVSSTTAPDRAAPEKRPVTQPAAIARDDQSPDRAERRDREAAAERRERAQRENARQAAVAVRRPQPPLPVFKFPQPSYVGVATQKYFPTVSYSKPERSNFAARYFRDIPKDIR